MKKTLCLIFLFLIASCFLLFGCDSESSADATTPPTYHISGKIIFNDEPLDNVKIYVDNLNVTVSNSSGAFYLSDLIENCSITFLKSGYTFNPNKVTVTSNNNSLVIFATATNENTDSDCDETIDNNDESGNVSDDSGEQENGDVSPVNTKTSAFIINPSFSTLDSVSLNFFVANFLTTFSLKVNNKENIFSVSDYTNSQSKVVDNVNYYLVSINIYDNLIAGINAIEIKSQIDDTSKCVNLSYIFSPILEAPKDLTLNGNILSWNGSDTNFKVYINNVLIIATSKNNIDLSPYISIDLIKSIKVCATKTNYTDSDFCDLIIEK